PRARRESTPSGATASVVHADRDGVRVRRPPDKARLSQRPAPGRLSPRGRLGSTQERAHAGSFDPLEDLARAVSTAGAVELRSQNWVPGPERRSRADYRAGCGTIRM